MVVILVAALGVVFAYKLGQQKSVNNSNGVVVDQNASDWDKDLDNLSGQQDSGIKMPGCGETPVSGAGDKSWKITLANPKDNDCYFKYSITIGDDERHRFMSLTILNRERQSVNFRSIRRWMKEIIQYI